MRLAEPGGDSVRIQVIRYQFPEATDYHDANWLMIRTEATDSFGSWTSEDPSLATFELSRLAAWLEALSLGGDAASELEFMERNHSFELVERKGDAVRLRVWLKPDSRPAFVTPRSPEEERNLSVDLTVRKSDLRAAAESLRADLHRFATRGEPAPRPEGRMREEGEVAFYRDGDDRWRWLVKAGIVGPVAEGSKSYSSQADAEQGALLAARVILTVLPSQSPAALDSRRHE